MSLKPFLENILRRHHFPSLELERLQWAGIIAPVDRSQFDLSDANVQLEMDDESTQVFVLPLPSTNRP